jgi:DNA-binding response OmpR family regulator
METQRVLVAEEDLEARLFIARLLESGGFRTATASDASEVLSSVRRDRFDLVILSVADSLDCCKGVREVSDIPIIMIVADADAKAICKGLDAGADDVLSKPFDPDEFISRVRAVVRRTRISSRIEAPLSLPTLQLGRLSIDFSSQTAMLVGTDLNLSGKELLLLYVLAKNCGSLLSRAHLMQEVWADAGLDDSKTLDVHVSRLRKKLDAAGEFGYLLKTVRNRGYMLSSEVETLSAKAAKAKS